MGYFCILNRRKNLKIPHPQNLEHFITLAIEQEKKYKKTKVVYSFQPRHTSSLDTWMRCSMLITTFGPSQHVADCGVPLYAWTLIKYLLDYCGNVGIPICVYLSACCKTNLNFGNLQRVLRIKRNMCTSTSDLTVFIYSLVTSTIG